MGRISNRTLALALSFSVSCASTTAFADPDAFPGAQGFGAVATGGRTGGVYVVTNLNDSGTGSFRDAVSHSNRIIVFAVSGHISLASAVSASSNLTILGQTAPGDGVAIEGAEVSFFGKSNDIVQHLRFRDGTGDPGYNGSSSTSSSSSNCLNLGNGTNMIFDHVSAEFAPYNNVDASSGTNNLTFSNSIIANPIASQRFNFHNEGANTTYIGNIFANSHGRDPLAKADTQFVNNIAYNYQYAFTTGNSAGTFRFDILNNYFVAGPSTNTPSDNFYQVDTNQSAYATGNMLDGNKDGTLNGSADNTTGAVVLSAPWSPTTMNLPILSAADAWAHDVANAGPNVKHDVSTYATSKGLDQVDSQVIADVTSNGTSGFLWTSESQTGLANGGFGTLNSGYLPTSTANDGIPDSWAKAHGISTTSASAAMLLNPLGYTMIEQYAYEISDLYATRTWTSSSGSWVSGSWSSAAPGLYDHALIRGNGATNGTATISGSDAATAFSVSIGGNGPATGESLTVSGGSLTVQDTITVGDQNNASLAISGGTVRTTNIQLGNTVRDSNGTITANYTGNLSLSGGTLALQQLVLGGGSAGNWNTGGTFNWSGGTIQAVGTLTVNVPTTFTGNGTLDTNGSSGTWSGIISGTGNLTKISAGALTLSGNNTFTGNTTISAGSIRASNNNALGTGTINVNAGSGLVLSNGITLNNNIVAAPGASEFEDVPDASATATITGNVSVSGGSNQYRLGVSGTNAVLRMTGTNTSSTITIITRGNIIFAGTGSLTNNSSAITIGRYGSSATLNFIVQDNAVIQGNGIALGGLNGSSDDATTTVNINGNGTISSGAAAFNLNNSATGGTVALNLNGTSLLKAGSFATNGSNQGQTTINFNGGTLQATASDSATPFFPALGTVSKPLNAAINAGGLTVNDGGFTITIAQPLAGSGPLAKTGNGSLTLSAVNSFTGPVAVIAGTLALAPTASLASTNVTIAQGAILNIQAVGNLPGTASVTSNGTVLLNASDTFASLTLGGSAGAWTGELDLAGNKLIIKPTPATKSATLATLQDQAAYGATHATGITSSTLPANFGIAVLDNAITNFSTFGGQSVDINSLLVAPELLGDANADGHVDLTDLSTVLNNFGTTTSAWTSGNFDNAATIDLTDLSAVLNNFGLTNPSATTELPIADYQLPAIPTPEPASLALLLLVPHALLRRSRKSVR
ncbi:MAG TPA: autotransporter-associated beta strand repeat-containing protein [Phycisphaerae bacterium]|nr:autotransporter-associated beta strand repeat-containing protein [Phycisphaerae bacterium]